MNRGLRGENALFSGNQLYYEHRLEKDISRTLEFTLVLPKKVIRESFNSNLMNEIAGLNSHSHSGVASFNRIASEIEHR